MVFAGRRFFSEWRPWLFSGGFSCFYGDIPFGEGVAFAKWIGRLVFYYAGRFSAGDAFPFVGLNMARRVRSVGRSGRCLKTT